MIKRTYFFRVSFKLNNGTTENISGVCFQVSFFSMAYSISTSMIDKAKKDFTDESGKPLYKHFEMTEFKRVY